jgi:hypothetical protein
MFGHRGSEGEKDVDCEWRKDAAWKRLEMVDLRNKVNGLERHWEEG